MIDQQANASGTVSRVARLLKQIAEADGEVSITSLSSELDLPPSTVHRLLHLLIAEGLVERVPGGHRYRAGLELCRIGALVADRLDVARTGRPVMQSLVAACEEFCMLCVYLPSEREIMIAETVKAPHPIGYTAEKYRKMSVVWGATGKAILAHLDPAEIEEIYRVTGPSPATGERLPPYDVFLDQLARIRAQGYAFTRGEKMPGAVGITSPIFGAEGHVVGSLCLTVPEMRFCPDTRPRLVEVLREHADRLSRALGYRSPGGRAGQADLAPAAMAAGAS